MPYRQDRQPGSGLIGLGFAPNVLDEAAYIGGPHDSL